MIAVLITVVVMLVAEWVLYQTNIQRVIENIGNIMQGDRLVKPNFVPLCSVILSLFINLMVNIPKLETVQSKFVCIFALVSGSFEMYDLARKYIKRRINEELNYKYSSKEAFNIFMTFVGLSVTYNYSAKIPDRDHTKEGLKIRKSMLEQELFYNEDDEQRVLNPNDPSTKKLISDIIDLKYGCFPERMQKITELGYNYREVQNLVNEEIKRRKTKEYDDLKERMRNDKDIIKLGLNESDIDIIAQNILSGLSKG